MKIKAILLEFLIVFFFMLALFFVLPVLASDEEMMRNPSLGLPTIVITFIFAISRALVIIRDIKIKNKGILFVSMAIQTIGFWVFTMILLEILKMNAPY